MKTKTAHEALLALTLACEQVRRVDAPPDLFSALAEAREVLRRLGGYDARIPQSEAFDRWWRHRPLTATAVDAFAAGWNARLDHLVAPEKPAGPVFDAIVEAAARRVVEMAKPKAPRHGV